MSESLAEAQVLIIPNTTGFRAALQAELTTATRGLVVPVPVAPVAVNPAQFQNLATATTAAASAQAVLGAESQRTKRALEDQARATKVASQRMGQLQSGATATTLTMSGLRGAAIGASGPFLAAAAAVTIFAKSIQSAANLETNLNVFRVTAKATAEEMERVADTARNLGADLTLPGVSAGDAAVAMTELAKAGLTVQDSLNGARGALQLATAAQIDNATATNLIATALNSFRLNGTEAVRVADLLTGAANESQGSIADMGLALQQAAAVASLVGISVEDTVTILTQLTQAGLKGSDAGTSLRTALIRLVNPTEKVKKTLAELNVQLRDAEGNIRPEFFGELGEALDRLSPAARQATTAILGGSDAVRAFGLLSRDAATGFQETRAAITEAGLAAELAGARTQGFAGKVENLKNQAETLGTALGQVAIGPLGLFVGGLADAASDLNTVVGGLQNMRQELDKMVSPLKEQIPLIDKVEGGFGDLAKTAVKLQLLGPTITIAAFAMKRFGDEAEDAAGKTSVFDSVVQSVEESIKGLTDSLQRAAQGAGAGVAAKGLSPEQITNRITGFDAQQVRAQIHGSNVELIASLRAEQEFLEQQLQRAVVERRPGLKRQLESQLLGVIQELASIQESSASEAKQVASEIRNARDAKDRAILDAIGLREQRARNAVARAEATGTIQDDIRSNIVLRNVFTSALNEIRKTVSDAKTKASAIANLTRELIAVRAEASRLQEELKEQRRRERQEARERQRESLQLDIDLAEVTGRRGAEVRARQAEIAFIKEQIRQTRAGSLQRKRLILELRQAQEELKELSQEKEKTNTFAQEAFGFLQKQQGFAANLLGNLIPSGATGGLVGGSQAAPPTPTSQLKAESQVGRTGGPTFGQAATEVDILKEMLRVLKSINGERAHPEARYQRASSGAAMDVM